MTVEKMIEISKQETYCIYCNERSVNEIIQKLRNLVLNNIEDINENLLFIQKEVVHDKGYGLFTEYNDIDISNFILNLLNSINSSDLVAIDINKAWEDADPTPSYKNYNIIYEKC